MIKKIHQKGFGSVETFLVIIVIVIIGFAGYYVLKNRGQSNSIVDDKVSKSNVNSIEIPELGVKILDRENRGIGIYYGDQSYYSNICATNPKYFGDPTTCDDYVTGNHCKEARINDKNHCFYYIYDGTTRTQESQNMTKDNNETGQFYKFYKCGTDLVIYEVDPNDPIYNKEQTKNSDKVIINGRQFMLSAHGATFDSDCDETAAITSSSYISDLLQYVKRNLAIE